MTARKNPKQRFFIAASAICFLGSMGMTTLHLYKSAAIDSAANPTANPSVNPIPAAEPSTLVLQEQGYEAVLGREPENQTALEGLVNTRLQLNDPKGAAAPLATLIKLHPGQQDYIDRMQQIQQQIVK